MCLPHSDLADSGAVFAATDLTHHVAFGTRVIFRGPVVPRRRRDVLVIRADIFGDHVGLHAATHDVVVARAMHGRVVTGVLFRPVLNVIGKFLPPTTSWGNSRIFLRAIERGGVR